MATKLNVAFVWHMHQPMYRDRTTHKYMMPWVRLHAQKDYLDMLALLARYPNVHQTFNLVPSLLEQIVDYAEHDAWDRMLELLVAPGESLTPDDQAYLLERGFDAHPAHMIAPYPRYAELAAVRAAQAGMPAAQRIQAFTLQDYVDLAVWFNLAWFDPLWLQSDPTLVRLVAKGRDFDTADQQALLATIRAHLRRVVPAYRERMESGQIELTTTPYYHPILPLLCDTDSARVARPGLKLPATRFMAPEDANRQIARGLAAFKSHFGTRARGMWPSEQSVSPEALGLIAQNGVSWAISDEGVLANSLGLRFGRTAQGLPQDAPGLYQPYRVDTPHGPLSLIFRDIVLSDLIGFTYASWPAEEAARDLYARLDRTRKLLPDGESYLVTIALDGENCWEHYPNDGADFLNAFYDLVSRDSALACVRVADYLERHPPRRAIEQIFSGSWISHDFTTWIGDPTKNLAWDMLAAARQALYSRQASLMGTPAWEAALEELDIAAGSDWFWWYGEGHDSGQDALFDAQFRLHVREIYRLIELPAPADTQLTLYKAPPLTAGTRFSPRLDGALAVGEWDAAGSYRPGGNQGAMHAASSGIELVQYGVSHDELYLAVSFSPRFCQAPGDMLEVLFFYPGRPQLTSPPSYGESGAGTAGYRFAHALRIELERPDTIQLLEAGEHDQWGAIAPLPGAALGEALELGLPLALLGQPAGQPVCFVVALARGSELVEIHPGDHALEFGMPVGASLAPV